MKGDAASTHTDITTISMKEAAPFFMVREEEGKVLGFVNGNLCLCVLYVNVLEGRGKGREGGRERGRQREWQRENEILRS